MRQIDMQHQTRQINIKYETAATPPGRFGSPRVGKFCFARLESAIVGLILAASLRFWIRPTARRHGPNRHATPNVPNKHRIRNRRNARGSPRMGEYFFLRLESSISGLILAAVLHFWIQPATHRHGPNRNATPNAPKKQKYETAATPPGRY